MKIILSRKGLDSATGRWTSAVLPDGRIAWVPIPADRRSRTRYRDVHHGPTGQNLGDLVGDLCGPTFRPQNFCHLDPDLDPRSLERKPGWRPVFGQTGAAQSHLDNEAVGPGDLFLFFGLFRNRAPAGAETDTRRTKAGRLEHRIFGWLQIAEHIRIGEDLETARQLRPWLADHPHTVRGPWGANNTVYVATDHLEVPGVAPDTPGGGLFEYAGESLRLTKPNETRPSRWLVPDFMIDSDGKPRSSYHRNARRAHRSTGSLFELTSVARGQEFVADIEDVRTDADRWIEELFKSGQGHDAKARRPLQKRPKRPCTGLTALNDPKTGADRDRRTYEGCRNTRCTTPSTKNEAT